MSTFHIIVVTIVCIAVVAAGVRFVRMRREDSRAAGARNLPVRGLGVIGYNANDFGHTEAGILAKQLLATKDHVWAEFQRIYGEATKYYVDRITMDPTLPKVASMRTGPPRIRLNPGMNYLRGFAAELHNLYRCDTFGPLTIYQAFSGADKRNMRKAGEVVRSI
jgi:hypothetical protein